MQIKFGSSGVQRWCHRRGAGTMNSSTKTPTNPSTELGAVSSRQYLLVLRNLQSHILLCSTLISPLFFFGWEVLDTTSFLQTFCTKGASWILCVCELRSNSVALETSPVGNVWPKLVVARELPLALSVSRFPCTIFTLVFVQCFFSLLLVAARPSRGF